MDFITQFSRALEQKCHDELNANYKDLMEKLIL